MSQRTRMIRRPATGRIEELANPLAGRMRWSGLGLIERQARLRRWAVVGSLASFLAFFGLSVAADWNRSSLPATETAPVAIVSAAGTSGENASAAAPVRRIRTRSS